MSGGFLSEVAANSRDEPSKAATDLRKGGFGIRWHPRGLVKERWRKVTLVNDDVLASAERLHRL